MDQVIAVFGRSIMKMVGRLVVGVVMMSACGLVAFHAVPNVATGGLAELAGALGFVFFGLAAIVMFGQLFRTAPVVEVRTSGIRDRRRSPDLISWTAIAKVSIDNVGSRRSLALQLRPGAKVRASRLGRAVGTLSGAAGIRGLSISMAGLDGSFDDLIRAIKKADAVSARAADAS